MGTEYNPLKDQDIAFAEFPVEDNSRFGSDILRAVKEFQVGSGATSFNANESGIWLGGKTFNSAPFSVDMNGVLHASGAVISGYITVGGAASDVNGGTTTISGGKITAGSIYGDRFVANVSITSPIITGGTIQTSATGDRIVLDGATNKLKFLNGSTLYGQIYPLAGGMGSGFFMETHGDYAISPASIGLYEPVSGHTSIDIEAETIYLDGGVDITGAAMTGDIIPSANNTYSIGSSTYRMQDIHTNALTLNGTQRTSWPTSFSGNWSDIVINGNKDMQGYNLTQLTQVIPHSSNTSTLGNSSYYWDYFYVGGIHGAGGVNPINMNNNVDFQSHNIQYVNDLDVNGAIDCEGAADFNTYVSVHGVLYMNSQQIRDVADPTSAQHAATKAWVEANFAPL